MSEPILKQEIEQQPGVIQDLLDNEYANIERITEKVKDSFDYIVIAARGTSDNAARYAQYLFGAHNQLPVALATPSLFTLYQEPPRLNGALAIGISQSGQSPDIVSVLAEAKRQGQPTLAIVNDIDSPLAATADYVLPLHAGKEKAVAATKTYTASLAALALFSALLQGNPDHLRELRLMPESMQTTISGLIPILDHVERYRYMDHCAVIGRGFNYSTAFEIALKIKELTRIITEPYSSADFRHGPIAIIDRGFPVIVVAPSGAVSEDLTDLVGNLKKLGSEMIMISDDPGLLDQSRFPLVIPRDIPEWLTPLIGILPGQLFAFRLTLEKGLNPDQPDGLTKITETY